MNTVTVLEFINIFFAGLLAGAEYTVRYGVRIPITVLETESQIVLRQALIRALRVAVPALFVPTILSAFAVTLIHGMSSGAVFRIIGLISILVWTLTTFLGTVPLNQDLLTWKAASPPEHWQRVIEKWDRLDLVRFVTATLTFVLFLGALAQRM